RARDGAQVWHPLSIARATRGAGPARGGVAAVAHAGSAAASRLPADRRGRRARAGPGCRASRPPRASGAKGGPRMTPVAAFARTLRQWTLQVTPPAHRVWARAMVREVEEIADDAAALEWALGCFAVCLWERIKSMLKLVLRTGLAGACALFAAGTA